MSFGKCRSVALSFPLLTDAASAGTAKVSSFLPIVKHKRDKKSAFRIVLTLAFHFFLAPLLSEGIYRSKTTSPITEKTSKSIYYEE